MTAEPLQILTFTSQAFAENAYLLRCTRTGEWAAIDPGAEAPAMAAAVEESGAPLVAIILTHAHFDHVEGVAELARRVPAPILLHPSDRPLYDAADQQGRVFGFAVTPPPPPDAALVPGETVRVGGCPLEVRHAPGHSPGHVILYSAEAGAAFVGDVVFQGAVGRTDLFGGNASELFRSIREQVLTLPDETRLYPGHGPVTTVGRERRTNPFLSPNFPGELA